MTHRIRTTAMLAAVALMAAACGSRIVGTDQAAAPEQGLVPPGVTTGTTAGTGTTTGTTGTTGLTTTTGGPTTGTTAGGATTGTNVTQRDCSGGATDTGVTASRIKLGMIISRTGPLPNQFNAAEDAVDAHLKMINAMGGVCGRQFELVIADDNGDTTNNTRLARRMVEEDKVFAFVGSHSANDDGMADVLCPANEPPLGVPDIGFPLGWRRTACDTTYGVPGQIQKNLIGHGASGSKFLNHKFDIKQAAIFWLRDSEVSVLSAWGFEAAMLKTKSDIEICYEQETSVFETGFAQFVAEMKDRCNDEQTAVYTTMENASNIRLAKAMRGQGFNPKVYAPTFTSYLESFIKDAEGATEGAYIAMPQIPFERCAEQNGKPVAPCSHPELERFVEALRIFRPGFDRPGSFGAPAWGQAALMVEAIGSCGGNLTRRCVLRFLDSSGPFTDQGFLSPTIPGDHEVYHADLLVQVQNGRFVEVPRPPGYEGPPGGADFWDNSTLFDWWGYYCANKSRFPDTGTKDRYIDCS